MFNSPLYYCAACKQYVALDQTKEECAREQDCKVVDCPLAHVFAKPNIGQNVSPESAGSTTRDKQA